MIRVVSVRHTPLLALGGLAAGLVYAAGTAAGGPPPALSRVASRVRVQRGAPSGHKELARRAAAPARARGGAGMLPLYVGDAAFRGKIDLSRAILRGDHYREKLPGGRTAVLTLDPDLQKAAEDVLARAHAPLGAVVVMSVDGRLLAYAGRRNMQPAVEDDYSLPAEVWAPSASVFKLVTTSALLAEGVSPHHKVCYHGGYHGINKSHLVDERYDDRCDDLAFALAKSQNAIIAKLAHRHLSRRILARFAHKLGFGVAPKFALPAQAPRDDIPKDPLEFARASAGFWHSELSPLGGAMLANTMATDGLRVTPRIVDAVIGTDGTRYPVVAPAPVRAIKKSIARRVAKMMIGTTGFGTAYHGFHDRRGRKFLHHIDVAGKTGTLDRTDPTFLEYSWFVGFAPAKAPRITIAVLLANPPKWYLKANTAARLILQTIF